MPATRVTASDLLPIGEIYDRGLALMTAAEREPPARPLQDSVHYRDGLMLALAAGTLLRRGNLAGLRIGVTLLETSEGYVLDIPAEEVKNRQPIEGPLPASLTPYLTRYLEHHRPRLLQGNRSDKLWISTEGRPMKVHQVGQRIARLSTASSLPSSTSLKQNAPLKIKEDSRCQRGHAPIFWGIEVYCWVKNQPD